MRVHCIQKASRSREVLNTKLKIHNTNRGTNNCTQHIINNSYNYIIISRIKYHVISLALMHWFIALAAAATIVTGVYSEEKCCMKANNYTMQMVDTAGSSDYVR